MEMRKTSGLLGCATILALALLSGCGGTSTTTSIPATATIFYGHNLIFRNNTAMTMGYNAFGQLGQGGLTNIAIATKVQFTGPVSGGATGGEHTLAFGNRSTVLAWGYNLYGQLGSAAVTTGSSTASYSAVAVAIQLPGHVTDVAAGGYHSLAIANGSVYAWGYNGYGQLGDGFFLNAATPVAVIDPLSRTNLGPAIQVAAGGNHSMALLQTGSVLTWGRNTTGQLGYLAPSGYSQAPQPVPFPQIPGVPATSTTPAIPSKDRTMRQIAADGSNSYAVESDDNTVWAWGYNIDGELGVPSTITGATGSPQQVLMADGVTPLHATKISAGGNHVLALVEDIAGNTSVWSWGFNGSGQLGTGFTTLSTAPTQVLGLPLGAQIIDIRAFGDYSMAKVAVPGSTIGAWYAWGDNGYGQLGNPIATSSIGYFTAPTLVLGYLP